MKLPRRSFLHLAAGAAALPVAPHLARPQAYPTRPITIIVPFSPGGPTDIIGRVLVERMRASLGQPIIIENVTGAGGSLGVGRRLQEFLDRDSAVEAGSPTTTDFLWQEHLTAMEG